MTNVSASASGSQRSARRFGPLLIATLVAVLLGVVIFGPELASLLFWVLLAAVAYALGFALKRWWIVPLPLLIAIPIGMSLRDPCDTGSPSDCDTAGLALVVLAAMGLIASITMLVGVIAGRRAQRSGATSARRRLS